MIPDKLSTLRKILSKRNLDAWIVPSADPHQSEYVADYWKTREWLSGFTGSAGTLVITLSQAGLWTDSRYFLQAEQELADTGIQLFKMGQPGAPTYLEWLRAELRIGAVIGFDGSLFSLAQVKTMRTMLRRKKIKLDYRADIVSRVWPDRPSLPENPVSDFPAMFAGETRASKITRIRERLRELKCNVHVVSSLDDIAWIFNIRGTDVLFNPVALGYAVITDDEARLFIHGHQLGDQLRAGLATDHIEISPYGHIRDFLKRLPRRCSVLLDPEKTNQLLKEAIPGHCRIVEAPNCSSRMKACKNKTELNGFRNAHIRDGIALVKWLHWLTSAIHQRPTEIAVADELTRFRREQPNFRGLSFAPIVGYKANGAIVHYSAKPESAAVLAPTGLLLVDSGAHYLDGTTDVTRTISLGNPTAEEKRFFTLVLKGHIALSRAVFPEGTTGAQLDTLARNYLWQSGLNYGHGTGHGVGHYLNVHEGPQQFRATNHIPLQPGMVTTNEPGLYFEGKFGIRIENVLHTRSKMENEFGRFLEFETITLCPIDRNLVDISLLIPEEKDWLNLYHAEVFSKLHPYLTDDERIWLRNATAAI
ncbi:MAG: aminopeptidase P family protein [Candidatus Zhuqueibacterota bacterium]